MGGGFALVALTAFAACSWVHLDKPTAPLPGQPVTCESDSRWPLVDAALSIASYSALLGMIGIIYVEQGSEGDKRPAQLAAASLVAISASGLVWAESSKHGEQALDACARFKRAER